jgi:glycerol-3-phosphate dehydrogenase
VRPVVSSHRAIDPSKETRDHLILEEQGLITVTGGKLTTFRSSAIMTLKRVAAHVLSLGALRGDLPVFAAPSADARAALSDLPAPTQARWLAAYGDDAAALRAMARPEELMAIAANGSTLAELRWAFRAEQVVHLDDALLRRTRLGLLLPRGAEELMSCTKDIARQEAGWNDARWEEEATRYRAVIARCYSVPRASS